MSAEQPTKRRKMATTAAETVHQASSSLLPVRPQGVHGLGLAQERETAAVQQERALLSDVTKVLDRLEALEEMHTEYNARTKEIKTRTTRWIRQIHGGQTMSEEDREALDSAVGELLGKCTMEPRLAERMENESAIHVYVGAKLLSLFFETGRLSPKREFHHGLLDEHYLSGVVRFCQELESYVLERAINLDVNSIKLCETIVEEINYCFLKFNFRNGPLRKRYDSLKYVVKNISSKLYELSLVLHGSHEPQKKSETEGINLVDENEFDIMQEEMDKRNERRERIIKGSRDIQKNAKKAIFALHRGNMKEARKLLDSCVKQASAIKEADPEASLHELHGGSFGESIEEYGEARLYEAWLNQDGAILSWSEFLSQVDMSESKYLGAISDFTGELGRYAVAKATQRDVDTVRKVLASLIWIDDMFAQVQAVTGDTKLLRKISQTWTNTRKVKVLLYEQVLVAKNKLASISPLEEAPPADYDEDNT